MRRAIRSRFLPDLLPVDHIKPCHSIIDAQGDLGLLMAWHLEETWYAIIERHQGGKIEAKTLKRV